MSLTKSPKEVGDVWFDNHIRDRLSHEYVRLARRPPVVIRLPGPVDFCPDQCADESEHGWVVIGEAPRLTLIPSVDIAGTGHGFVRGGVISDDLGGRGYDATGRPLT